MSDEELRRSQRAYTVLARCNQLIVHELSATALVQRFCTLAVEQAGYRFAWFGRADPDGRVVAEAQAGIGLEYLATANITWRDGPRSLGPVGTCIRERRVVTAQHIPTDPQFEPWRAAALEHGYRSCISLPLLDTDRVLGALTLYATEEDAFDGPELALLTELASDLAYGLRASERRSELERAVEALARAERLDATARAASGAVHDLNGMLSVIASATASISLNPQARPLVHEELKDINAALDRAAELTRQVFRLGRREPARSAVVTPGDAIEAAWPMFLRLLRPAQTALLEHGETAPVRADPLGFEQVVLNLVTNALDAMPDGGVLRVSTHLTQLSRRTPLAVGVLTPGRWVRLSVQDTGVGMSPETLERIFEPFFTTRTHGNGVGLSTVFALVSGWGGAIDVTSTPGHGSRFDVYLPCAESQVTAAPAPH